MSACSMWQNCLIENLVLLLGDILFSLVTQLLLADFYIVWFWFPYLVVFNPTGSERQSWWFCSYNQGLGKLENFRLQIPILLSRRGAMKLFPRFILSFELSFRLKCLQRDFCENVKSWNFSERFPKLLEE